MAGARTQYISTFAKLSMYCLMWFMGIFNLGLKERKVAEYYRIKNEQNSKWVLVFNKIIYS